MMNLPRIWASTALLCCLSLGLLAQKYKDKRVTAFNCEFDVLSGLAEVIKVEKIRPANQSPLGYDEYRVLFRFEPREGPPLQVALQDQELEFFLRKDKTRVPVGPNYLKQYQVKEGYKYAMRFWQPAKVAGNNCFCDYWMDGEFGGLPNDLFEARDKVQDLLRVQAEEKLRKAEEQHGYASNDEDPQNLGLVNPDAPKPQNIPKPQNSPNSSAEELAKAEKQAQAQREAEKQAEKEAEAQRIKETQNSATQATTNNPNPEPEPEERIELDLNEDLLRAELEAKLRVEIETQLERERLEKERAERERLEKERKLNERELKKQRKQNEKEEKERLKQQQLEEERKRKAIEAEKERRLREIEAEIREKILAETKQRKEEEKNQTEERKQQEAQAEEERKQQAQEQAKQQAFQQAKQQQSENEIKRLDCKYGPKVSGLIKIVGVSKVREAEESLFGYAEYQVRYRFTPDNLTDLDKKSKQKWENEQSLILDPMGKNAFPSASYILKYKVTKDSQYKGFGQVLETGICAETQVFAPDLPIGAAQVK